MTEIDAWYTLQNLFEVTDILEGKEYDLRNWRDVREIVSKLDRITGNAVRLQKENEQLKSEIEKLSKFENNGEHIRLSINIETGELQRYIYATGQWFGDFDRVLCTNWITEKDYQKFIDRVIEIYNTEFKGDVE